MPSKCSVPVHLVVHVKVDDDDHVKVSVDAGVDFDVVVDSDVVVDFDVDLCLDLDRTLCL